MTSLLVGIPDVVVWLFASAFGLWGGLTLLATDMVEARVQKRLEEVSRKRKIGKRGQPR